MKHLGFHPVLRRAIEPLTATGLAGLALVLTSAALTACGGGNDSKDKVDSQAGGNDPDERGGELPRQKGVKTRDDGTRSCPPTPRPAQRDSQATVGTGAPLRLDLSKYGTRLVVNVEGAQSAADIGGVGGYAASRGEFVVVTYRVHNAGKQAVEAAVVNGLFAINAGGRFDYGRAENASGCKASILFAKKAVPAAEVSEIDLQPGQSYRTLGAYVVPRPKRRVFWVAGDGTYRVKLTAENQ